jgi:endonuclease/exonuclease/phosphatase family metal-dependent hydrolase
MEVSVATFNLNNLFGRWNLYVDAPQPPPTGVPAPAEAAATATPAATTPDRDWLEEAPAVEAASSARRRRLPDVKIVIEGRLTAEGIKWRTNPADGKVVFKKKPEATRKLAERIKALDVDVLAVQEVENIEALDEFVETNGLRRAGYRHLVLVEGNDDRLIDVGVISRLPIGAVSSWRHRTYGNRPRSRPIFSRDLLQVDVLAETRNRVLLTIYVNHLKSRLARNPQERRAGNQRRKRQAETIAAIIAERPPPGPFVVLGDLNDTPEASRLRPLRDLGLINGLADPDETGGPYPADDPDQPRTKAWTHRFRAERRTDYELFDQIWLSPDLRSKQTAAWIQRRTTRGGDATDHDPAAVRLDL